VGWPNRRWLFFWKCPMPNPARAIAFDVDSESLASFREAFPEWEIESVQGATTESLDKHWNPATADLLVVGAGDQISRAVGLCRSLRSQSGQTRTPLLVLVAPGQDVLVKAALEAGADSCLVLPVHSKDFAGMVARVCKGNQPGLHTLNLDRAQREDRWRDEGGES
jgi:DNA-binding response OmpR family regulator